MKRYYGIIFFLFLIIIQKNGNSQCAAVVPVNCDPALSDIILTTPDRIELVFDSFSEYKGGITLNGSSIIRLKIISNVLPPFPCQWKLRMIVSNNAWAVPTDFETVVPYGGGASGVPPALDLLELRVSNVCNTATNSGMWQTFAPLTGSTLDIINSALLTPAGTCNPATPTNGEGSYLTNYNEFVFNIDYRLKPFDAVSGFIYAPGRYELHIKFCLQEM
jgi:hypothetical protein